MVYDRIKYFGLFGISMRFVGGVSNIMWPVLADARRILVIKPCRIPYFILKQMKVYVKRKIAFLKILGRYKVRETERPEDESEKDKDILRNVILNKACKTEQPKHEIRINVHSRVTGTHLGEGLSGHKLTTIF